MYLYTSSWAEGPRSSRLGGDVTEDSLTPPPAINFARVLEYAPLDQWEGRSTEGPSPAETEGIAAVASLAIAQPANGPGVFLFHCDRAWKVLGAAPCASLFEAEHLAERIYPGISSSWTDARVTEEDLGRYLYRMWSGDRCHFCGKEAGPGSRFVERSGARICESCVEDCSRLLSIDRDHKARNAS